MDKILKIKTLLKSKKMTYEDLSKAIGKSKPTVVNYFKGTSKIDIDTIEKIASVLNVPVSYFFDKESGGSNIGNFQDTSIVNNTGSNFNISTGGGKKEAIEAEKKELRKNNLMYWDMIENMVNNLTGLMANIVEEKPEIQPFIAKQNEFKLFIRQLNTLIKLTDNNLLINDSFFDFFENPY